MHDAENSPKGSVAEPMFRRILDKLALSVGIEAWEPCESQLIKAAHVKNALVAMVRQERQIVSMHRITGDGDIDIRDV